MSNDEFVARGPAEEIDTPTTRSEAGWDCIYLNFDMPPSPKRVDLTLPIDADVLEWFTTMEGDFDANINQVLRACIDAQTERWDG